MRTNKKDRPTSGLKTSGSCAITKNMPMHTLCWPARTFPGGEVFPRPETTLTEDGGLEVAAVRASLTNSDQVMALLMLHDALKREGFFAGRKSILQLGYFPYARQDRVANFGESLSAKVMAQLINGMCFDQVHILDPHSDVTSALVNDCKVIPAHEPVRNRVDLPELFQHVVLVSPDAGATKKVDAFAKSMSNWRPVLQAGKTRCTVTGNITGTWLADMQFDGPQDFAVFDDICDGGRTFRELAKVIRQNHAVRSLHLHVSHGIFSKGLETILEHYDTVTTTDSIAQTPHPRLTVIPAFNQSF